MYLQQKGILPTFTYLLGLAILCVCFVIGVIAVGVAAYTSEGGLPTVAANTVAAFLIIIAVLSPLLLMSIFFGSMFPEVKPTKEGLWFRVLVFFSGVVMWKDIEGLAEVNIPAKCVAVVVSSTLVGSLLRGMWANAIYGIVNRFDRPLILLSPGLEKRQHVIDEIRSNIVGRQPFSQG